MAYKTYNPSSLSIPSLLPMSSSSIHLFISTIAVLSFLSYGSTKKPDPRGIVYPIEKDEQSLQYYTKIKIGSPVLDQNIVIDLNGESIWIDCDVYNSSSFHPITCKTTKCKSMNLPYCVYCNGPYRPGCSNYTCGSDAFNPFLPGSSIASMNEDFVKNLGEPFRLAFLCGNTVLNRGLASGAKGIGGLGRTNQSMHNQVAKVFNLTHKFAICLPSSSKVGLGGIFIGGGPYYEKNNKKDLSKLFITTPLLVNPKNPNIWVPGPSPEYFIDVESIKIDGNLVPLNASLLVIDPETGVGGAKISTVDPYTILQSTIYEAVTKAFVKDMTLRKNKRVKSGTPFGVCFESKTTNADTMKLPTIDFVFKNKGAYWRLYTHNLMVKVNKDVSCLGFVDGGLEAGASIVLGGHQLEDNLIEFDLVSSKLWFTNLLVHNTSCSNLNYSY